MRLTEYSELSYFWLCIYSIFQKNSKNKKNGLNQTDRKKIIVVLWTDVQGNELETAFWRIPRSILYIFLVKNRCEKCNWQGLALEIIHVAGSRKF